MSPSHPLHIHIYVCFDPSSLLVPFILSSKWSRSPERCWWWRPSITQTSSLLVVVSSWSTFSGAGHGRVISTKKIIQLFSSLHPYILYIYIYIHISKSNTYSSFMQLYKTNAPRGVSCVGVTISTFLVQNEMMMMMVYVCCVYVYTVGVEEKHCVSRQPEVVTIVTPTKKHSQQRNGINSLADNVHRCFKWRNKCVLFGTATSKQLWPISNWKTLCYAGSLHQSSACRPVHITFLSFFLLSLCCCCCLPPSTFKQSIFF